MLAWRPRDQIIDWWARARTLIASPPSLSPATGRWLWRSVRTMSASTLASPGSDFAPEVECAVPVTATSTSGSPRTPGNRRPPRRSTNRPRSVSIPITTSPGSSAWAPTSSWNRAMPSTPSGSGPGPGVCRPHLRRTHRGGLQPNPPQRRSSSPVLLLGPAPTPSHEAASSPLMTLLCCVKSVEGSEQVAGQVALEATADLFVGLAFGPSSFHVDERGWVAAHPGDATMCRARLSWRSPRRFSRCRSLRPVDTGIGAVPEAWRRRLRCGSVRRATRQQDLGRAERADADLGGDHTGGQVLDDLGDLGFQFGHQLGQGHDREATLAKV